MSGPSETRSAWRLLVVLGLLSCGRAAVAPPAAPVGPFGSMIDALQVSSPTCAAGNVCAGTGLADSGCFEFVTGPRLKRYFAQTFQAVSSGAPGQLHLIVTRMFDPPAGLGAHLRVTVQTLNGSFLANQQPDPPNEIAAGHADLTQIPLQSTQDTRIVLSSSADPTTWLQAGLTYAFVGYLEEENAYQLASQTFSASVACYPSNVYTKGTAWVRQMRAAGVNTFTSPAWTPDVRDIAFSMSVNDGCIAGATQTCGIGQCRHTIPTCDSGGNLLTCTPLPAGSETCNGLDDDCDGVVDNGSALCTTPPNTVCWSSSGTCTAGACVYPQLAPGTACPDDGNACTTDACNASGVCAHPNKANGTSCNDGNACTSGDQCTNGSCGGTAYTCTATSCQTSSVCAGNGTCTVVNMAAGAACPDDGNPCTTDLCDGSGTCAHANLANGTSCGAGLVCSAGSCQAGCVIGGIFYPANATNGGCQYCNPSVSTSAWTNRTNGTACNDGNACTANDACASGTCGGTAYSCSPTACQSTSVCDGAGGCTVTNKASGTACPDDGNRCTSDSCNGSGTCLHPNLALGASCGSGMICNGSGSCGAGCAIGGSYVAGGTANGPCQTCNPSVSTTGWSNVANGTSCNDGNACTYSDSCTNGSCGGTAYSCSPTACMTSSTCSGFGGCLISYAAYGSACPDDGNPCTSDICDGGGGCSHPAVANGTSCGAGLVCVSGSCSNSCVIGGTVYPSGITNPGNPCQICNPSLSTSAWSNKASGTACPDDGSYCTTDSCDGNGACVHPSLAVGTSCGPGVICNGSGSCAMGCAIGGSFVAYGTTNGSCQTCNSSVSTTSWSNVANGTPCNDGNACTYSDICMNGTCAGTFYSCTPGACQASSTCNGAGGCNITPTTSGSACADDGNPCTYDFCSAGSCTHPAVTNGAPCGSGLVCSNGSCVSGCVIAGTTYANGATNPSNPCQACNMTVSTSAWSNKASGSACPDDGLVCTSDVCNGAGSCTHPALALGTSCGPGQICNGGGGCASACDIGGTYYGAGTANGPCQTCNPSASTSSWTNVANGTACNDGNLCTYNDSCTNGSCGGIAYGCSPGVCQSASTCNGAGGCSVTYSGPGAGCADDGNPCTADSCNGSGSCTHPAVANGTACPGGTCSGGSCLAYSYYWSTGSWSACSASCGGGTQTRSVTCMRSDGVAVSSAYCGTAPASSQSCSDYSGCSYSWSVGGWSACSLSGCSGTQTRSIACVRSDGTVVSSAYCGAAPATSQGCTAPNGTGCSDGNACTSGDSCSNGSCVGGASLSCADSNPCTDDSCNPSSGCVHTTSADGTSCGSGSVCCGGGCTAISYGFAGASCGSCGQSCNSGSGFACASDNTCHCNGDPTDNRINCSLGGGGGGTTCAWLRCDPSTQAFNLCCAGTSTPGCDGTVPTCL